MKYINYEQLITHNLYHFSSFRYIDEHLPSNEFYLCSKCERNVFLLISKNKTFDPQESINKYRIELDVMCYTCKIIVDLTYRTKDLSTNFVVMPLTIEI